MEETCELVLGERANSGDPAHGIRQASPVAALPFVPYHPEELRRRRKARAAAEVSLRRLIGHKPAGSLSPPRISRHQIFSAMACSWADAND